jgi:hypothetical protein
LPVPNATKIRLNSKYEIPSKEGKTLQKKRNPFKRREIPSKEAKSLQKKRNPFK